jgi:hypothetical protein
MEQAVRSLCLRLLCLLLPLFGAAAAAEAPFAPIAKVPDYVVTMVERQFQSEQTRPRIVRHHGNWTRVDRVDQPLDMATPQNIAAYFSADGKTEIRVYQSDFRVRMIRGAEPSPGRDMAPRNTGERQSHLGESCAVWEAWRIASGPTGGLTHLSCITDDGIELWRKSVFRHGVLGSAEATRIERRAVAPEEVRPMLRRLVPDWWASDLGEATTQAMPDHEIVMTSGSGAVRTTRRHGAWQSVEVTSKGWRQIRITHSGLSQPALEYTSDNAGAPKQLFITRPAPIVVVLSQMTRAADLDRTETVLGETCHWFDMTPGRLMNEGLKLCQTDDGIVLKERGWTAVRLDRRPVSLDEIQSPEILHDPRAWGIR